MTWEENDPVLRAIEALGSLHAPSEWAEGYDAAIGDAYEAARTEIAKHMKGEES